MKIAVLLCLCLLLTLCACSSEPASTGTSSASPSSSSAPADPMDTIKGDVVKITTSHDPQSETYERTIEDAQQIEDILEYLYAMTLKNPTAENHYDGGTLSITLHYRDHSQKTVMSSANRLMRLDDSVWYQMDYLQAIQLEKLLMGWD